MPAEPNAESPQAILDRLALAMGVTFAVLLRLVPDDQTLRPMAQHQWPSAYRGWLTGLRIRVGDGPSGVAVAERRLIEVPDMLGAGVPADWREVARELGFAAMVVAPVLAAEGPVGALACYFAEVTKVTEAHRTLIGTAADQLAAVMRSERRTPPPVGAQRILQG